MILKESAGKLCSKFMGLYVVQIKVDMTLVAKLLRKFATDYMCKDILCNCEVRIKNMIYIAISNGKLFQYNLWIDKIMMQFISLDY